MYTERSDLDVFDHPVYPLSNESESSSHPWPMRPRSAARGAPELLPRVRRPNRSRLVVSTHICCFISPALAPFPAFCVAARSRSRFRSSFEYPTVTLHHRHYDRPAEADQGVVVYVRSCTLMHWKTA